MSIIAYFRPKTKARLMAGEYVQWIDGHKTRSRYLRACVLSYPDWVDRAELKKLWNECRRLERETGVPYTIDHIIPLNHPKVCGLSVPWNMQVMTHKANMAKGNKWNPDQLDLFE